MATNVADCSPGKAMEESWDRCRLTSAHFDNLSSDETYGTRILSERISWFELKQACPDRRLCELSPLLCEGGKIDTYFSSTARKSLAYEYASVCSTRLDFVSTSRPRITSFKVCRT